MAKVLVVGAAGGIGGAVLRALAARGDTVTATVRRADEAERLEADWPGVAVHGVDLDDADRARTALRAIVDGLDRLDAVVFCAGIAPFGPTEHTPLSQFRQVMEVNAFGAVAVFQATIGRLRQSRGRYLIVSSLCGRLALPIMAAYSASKFALEALADVMRREVAVDGVDIVVVQPGGVRTGMVDEQAATARATRDALPGDGAARYGGLYDSYHRLVTGVSDDPPSTPEQVAAAMLAALDAPDPHPRYPIGSDAVQAIEALQGMDDRGADAMVGQMLSR